MVTRGFLLGAATAVAAVATVFWLVPTIEGQAVFRDGDRSDHISRVQFFGAAGSSIGVSVRDVERADVGKLKLPARSGAVVEFVEADSPAARAGFAAADVVVAFDGETVRSARQLVRLVQETPPDRTVSARVLRRGGPIDLSVTTRAGSSRLSREWRNLRDDLPAMPDLSELEELPQRLRDVYRGGAGVLGVSVQSMSVDLLKYFGAANGVLVASVRADSPAARAGIKVGDVIASVSGSAIHSAGELRRRIVEAQGNEVTLGIVRERKSISVSVAVEDTRRAAESGWPV